MTEQSVGKQSERSARVITGVVIAAVLVALWALRGWPARIAIALFMGVMLWETYGAFEHRGERPAKWAGIAYALMIVPATQLVGEKALVLLPILAAIASLATVVLRGKADYPSAAASIVPLICPGLLMSCLLPLIDIKQAALSSAGLGLALLLPLGNDVAAYEVGTRLGRHKLCPELSPKKSVEGAVAGAITSVILSVLVPPVIALLFRRPLADLPALWHFALIGLLGGVAAPVGDLTASMIKRYCGVKDFSNLLPGHGGFMDRLDSVMFTGAVVYGYFALVLGAI